MSRVLGIDPGLATIGLGYVDSTSSQDIRAGEWLTISTAAGLSLHDRLKEIYHDLTTYVSTVRPDLVVVEKLFFATNQKTALDVAHARGIILLVIAEAGIPLLEATPLQLKNGLTGDGGADKKQVQQMLVHMLKLPKAPSPDDAADALGLAVYGALQQNALLLENN